MWGSSEPDPGGTENTDPAPNSQELNDLKDQFEQQQVLIAQLKEMLRKTEQTTVTQEKLEEYANTLTRMKGRAKKKGPDGDAPDSSANEKILLLRQQMEENKLKLAERKKFQKGMEETVTQLKAQFDDSQHYLNQSLNLSLSEPKVEDYNANSSSEELFNLLLTKEKKLTDLTAKIHKLEANVLDLQENVKEKDSVIDARTKAITLMTESLSKKGKNTLDALDDTKDQMRKMQENFVSLEMEMKAEKRRLMNELEEKVEEIDRLNENNYVLEKTCQEQQSEITELSEKSKTSAKQLEGVNARIKELEKLNSELESKSSPQRSKKGKKGSKAANLDAEKLLQYEATIEELKLKLESVARSEPTNESEEVAMLKKQLDESNKNAIKTKAQHKAKVKELSKKLEALKSNEAIKDLAKLQDELVTLNERIEILRDENARLAAKSTEDLEVKIQTLSESLEKKDEEIRDLEQKLNAQKTQVETEITSIHLEEQIDHLELEKANFQKEKDALLEEKNALIEKFDALTKEKQDLVNKLDSYMQENMDLIDKLEKLSTEKVSSAESIEIVEGLTQQEKLELEAYQKSLTKSSHENLTENPELNESVNQLTEETSDLLQKIELFTEERREVMDKMEALTAENSHLVAKIQEVENNRDLLSETYEQLQNEKEELESKFEQETKRAEELQRNLDQLRKENESLQDNLNEIKHGSQVEETVKFEHVMPLERNKAEPDHIEEYKKLIEIQKVEIQELRVQLLSQQDYATQLFTLEAKYESLLGENEALRKQLKDKSESVYEKDSLESELSEARTRIQTLEEKLIANLSEIEDYKAILEQNKEELVSSSDKICKLDGEASTREAEIADLNRFIKQLQSETTRVKEQDESLNLMSNQLQDLKFLLGENLKQIEIYEGELEHNTKTISNLNIQLSELNGKMDEMEEDLQEKDEKIALLVGDKQEKEQTIANLNNELKFKEENFHQTCNGLKEKYLALHAKIEQNADSLDNIKNPSSKIQELESKNKEQLDKMKKIAANLKRKTAAYQELENKYQTEHEKWESESKEKTHLEDALKTKESEIGEVKTKFRSLIEQLTDLENTLTESNTKNDNLKLENDQLRNSITNYELQLSDFARAREMYQSYESNNLNVEISEKNQVIESLRQELDSLNYNTQIHSNALGVKVEELEMVVETQDSELAKYRERIAKLEEVLSLMEERRLALEQKTYELDEQLREKSNSYEEISQTEDFLEQRLALLMSQDEKIQRCLNETKIENQDLLEHNRVLLDENKRLKIQLSDDKMDEVAALHEKLNDYYKENMMLNESLASLSEQYEQLKVTHEKKKKEVELLEGELQSELEQLDDERRTLSIQCEHLQDELKRYNETQRLQQVQIEEYRQKIEQQQTDFDSLMGEYDQLDRQNKTNLHDKELLEITFKGELAKFEEILDRKNLEVSNYESELRKREEIDQVRSRSLGSTAVVGEEPSNVSTFMWPTSSPSDDPFAFVQQGRETGEPVAEQATGLFDFAEPQNEQLQQSYDPFDAALQQQHQPVEARPQETRAERKLDDGKDELLKKIKTLEFMLYNIELEKDDVLLQCQSLTNEITRLVYERQNTQICSPDAAVMTDKDREELRYVEFVPTNEEFAQEEPVKATSAYLCYEPSSIDAQVVSLDETDLTRGDLQILRKVEFEECKPCESSANLEPVTEEPCVAKAEYLCFEDGPKQTDASRVEQQIVSSQDMHVTPTERTQLHELEFVQTDSSKKVEQPAKYENAYLCFPTNQGGPSTSSTTNLDIFDENDDGWGCGMDEVKLEEDHRQQVDTITINRRLNTQLEELDEKVRVLELERDRHLEEIKQGQIKSGKLIKKLKEFKTLNEKLNSDLKKSDGFGDLNDTIVEELKSQISRLEKKIKENQIELDKEKVEKNNLLKKVDALQTANDRFNEMKEKQEVELMSFKRQNSELTAKLDQFEWGSEGFDSPKRDVFASKPSSGEDDKKVQELVNTIQELTLDNEELQAMLEEQRNLRVKAERAKSVEPILENVQTEYSALLNEKAALASELKLRTDEKQSLEVELQDVRQTLNEAQTKLEILQSEKDQLDRSTQQLKNQAQAKLATLHSERDQLDQLTQELQNVQLEKDNLTRSSSDERAKISQLETENVELKRHFEELREYVSSIEKQKIDVEESLRTKCSQVETLKTVIEELETSLSNYEVQATEFELKVKRHSEDISNVDRELAETVAQRDALQASIEQLEIEWSRRVDQRGADIAESWKLHLDMRETEFVQVEKQLRKELADLETKCSGLVNENNELRKNVDAEIRNEIDKIAALQQQITSREHHINDLTRLIQESQASAAEQTAQLVQANETVAAQTVQLVQANETIAAQTAQLVQANETVTAQTAQLVQANETVAAQTAQLEETKQKLTQLEALHDELQQRDFLVANLQSELSEKQQKLDRSDLACKDLQLDNEQRVLLEQQLQDVRQALSELQAQNDSLNQLAASLNVQLEDKQSQLEESYRKFEESLQVKDSEVNKLKNEIHNLAVTLRDKEAASSLNDDLETRNRTLQERNDTSEFELQQLRAQLGQYELLLNEKEREYSQNLTATSQENESVLLEKIQEIDILKRRQAEVETHYEDLLVAKNLDLQNLSLQLQSEIDKCTELARIVDQKDEIVDDLRRQFELKVQECEEAQRKFFEQNTLHDEENKQVSELRLIIEDQVMKIEELKEDLFEKSNDYDSLIAELDITKIRNASEGRPPQAQTKPEDDGSEPVSNSEYNLALYLLHQRDVRCEELTLELTQLLEERDTLQLKLSNAIREKEDLRRKLPSGGHDETAVATASSSTTPAEPVVLLETPEQTESRNDTERLNSKLSELKSVGYRRDKTLLDEQEQRRYQEMSFMQHHRDVVSLLPPEAAARLVQDANYTLSRDVQSPSKVLLNWLWGKSTPKVNDI